MDMAQNQGLYDTSYYPQYHLLYSVANKNVLGKLKDQCAGRAIAEFIDLRPRDKKHLQGLWLQHKEGQGNKKATVKKHIRHDQ